MGTLGVIGAGKLGTTLGQAAAAAGWQVLFNDISELAGMIVETMVPDAELVGLPELVERADIVLLALPYGVSQGLDYGLFDNIVVLDPMNYWAAVDGTLADNGTGEAGTSAQVAARNPRMRLVKSLNHLGYHDYTADARPAGQPDRRAVAVASDDAAAQALVARLVDDLGFEPLPVPFDRAALLEPGGPVFGNWLDAASMRAALG